MNRPPINTRLGGFRRAPRNLETELRRTLQCGDGVDLLAQAKAVMAELEEFRRAAAIKHVIKRHGGLGE